MSLGPPPGLAKNVQGFEILLLWNDFELIDGMKLQKVDEGKEARKEDAARALLAGQLPSGADVDDPFEGMSPQVAYALGRVPPSSLRAPPLLSPIMWKCFQHAIPLELNFVYLLVSYAHCFQKQGTPLSKEQKSLTHLSTLPLIRQM